MSIKDFISKKIITYIYIYIIDCQSIYKSMKTSKIIPLVSYDILSQIYELIIIKCIDTQSVHGSCTLDVHKDITSDI